MNKKHIESVREGNSETITWILGMNGVVKEKVKDYIKEQGVKVFLLKYHNIELEPEEQEKIKVLKRVLQTFDGDIEAINFGDMDEGC
ncbi:MAG: hypothetical protein CVV00_01715 [Firmicutes bacterium HGW-Firmicutes-5]|nr:MAG: hypothetical protein CVV00_01715 [Firmicutes bacterium HGW-Firmicutes-5]